MLRKLRAFLAALLLVPVLTTNASAFTTESDDALNPSRPKSGWCVTYWNGSWIMYPC
jgi:hypothetical protein